MAGSNVLANITSGCSTMSSLLVSSVSISLVWFILQLFGCVRLRGCRVVVVCQHSVSSCSIGPHVIVNHFSIHSPGFSCVFLYSSIHRYGLVDTYYPFIHPSILLSRVSSHFHSFIIAGIFFDSSRCCPWSSSHSSSFQVFPVATVAFIREVSMLFHGVFVVDRLFVTA